jgi:hypothetical protein
VNLTAVQRIQRVQEVCNREQRRAGSANAGFFARQNRIT